jgi:thioredoxin-like negative regulator of GroEL
MIMQEWYRSRALYEAVLKLVNSGKTEEALQMADGIPDRVIRSKAFSHIAIEVARNGRDYGEALERAVKAALDIENHEESTKALMSLAFEFLNLGKPDEAMRISRHITDLSNRSKVEAEVALTLAKAGKISEAMEIINGIMDDDVKTWAMSRLASQL